MIICPECEKELKDDDPYCSRCGYEIRQHNKENKPIIKKYGKLATAAYTFMIIGTILSVLYFLLTTVYFFALPLFWCIPLDIYFWNKVKSGQKIPTVAIIFIIIFVSKIGGCMALAMGEPKIKVK
jgi:hypothetical protein